ncbi:MAG: SDR family oxidoreductase [Patescibacteria group bacterium]
MKTILISGGSSGLGQATAEKLAKKYKVVILAPDAKRIKEVAAKIGCDFQVADVTDYGQLEGAVEETIKKHGGIDVLINNAGIWIEGNLETNDPERIQKTMAVNAVGTMLLTRAVLPHMKKAGRGRIINVISQAGLTAKPERSVYNGSKWAITGFTKSLATELTGSGITVTGFYPGAMKTNLFASAGVKKNEEKYSKYMELADVVRALEFVVETPEELEIPELGIKPGWY